MMFSKCEKKEGRGWVKGDWGFLIYEREREREREKKGEEKERERGNTTQRIHSYIILKKSGGEKKEEEKKR